MTIEALVSYKNCSYLGFDRNERSPREASSIFAKFETSISGFPSIDPFNKDAIC
ncbi:hypothetical protein D3C71_2049360 [compost metagenome]